MASDRLTGQKFALPIAKEQDPVVVLIMGADPPGIFGYAKQIEIVIGRAMKNQIFPLSAVMTFDSNCQ